MKLAKLVLPIVVLLFIAACGSHGPDSARGPAAKKPASIIADSFGPIDSTLNDSLRAIERRSGGRIGVAAILLENGWRTSYRGKETFPMASVAKLPMAIRFLRLVDSGALRLDSVVRFSPIDYHPGASVLYRQTMHDSGGATMLHALLEAMITHSDNTAADYILKLEGGPRTVDNMMASLGLEHIDVSNSERDLILLWAGIDPRKTDSVWTRERVYRKMSEADDSLWKRAHARLVDDPADAAPPNELALLLAMLQRRSLLGPRSTDTLLAIMSRIVTGNARMPALLPEGTPVAHKTGTISSTANDIGIITLPEGRGHLVVAICVKGSVANVRVRDRAIADAAALVYRRALVRSKPGGR
jgi:beta-lactamase class A